jgi:protein O-mannosyl-transferase
MRMNERSESNKFRLGAIIVLVLTLVAHVRSLQGKFVEWDDTTHITRNPAIRSLSFESVRVMFTKPIAKLYCPLTWLSYAVDYRIWNQDPFGYHLTNLLLHLANTLLVLVLTSMVLRDRWKHATTTALLTAAIFGIHPLRVESVAWVTERKDVLFAFFYLSALIVYCRWLDTHKLRNYWVCFGLFVASVLSKSTAVTLPLILLLLDHFLARRKAWAEKLPFFAVSLIMTAITFLSQSSGQGQTVAGPDVIPLWARTGLIGYCALFYVRKFFWPLHLSAVYPIFDEMNWGILINLEYIAAFALITILAIATRRRWPALLPSWLFYVIMLSPTIGLVPVGIHVVADRFSYMPLIGLALPVSMAVAWAFASMPNTVTRFAFGGVIAVVLATLVCLTDERGAVWYNTETLFLNALQENPNCLPAEVNLTYWYTSVKDTDDAIKHGLRAIAIAPQGIIGRKDLAYAYINAGQRREAIAVLKPLAQEGVEDAEVWRGLADCFEALGDTNNAKLARDSQHRCEGKL